MEVFYRLNYGTNFYLFLEAKSLVDVLLWLNTQQEVKMLTILAPGKTTMHEPEVSD